MAGSVNKVILVGNLGKDPEIRSTQSGQKIANLALATSDTWNDKASGERKERTEWHKVVIFNERLADVAERFLRKGRKVYVEGTLQTRKWTDQGGQERYTTEVVLDRFNGVLVLIDSNRGDDQGEGAGGSQGGYNQGGYNQGGGYGQSAPQAAPAGNRSGGGGQSWDSNSRATADLDDDIPF